MYNNNELIEFFNLKEIFASGERYCIPVYQRNYEWQEKHISQLLNDVKDYYLQQQDSKYYIGTLIVNRVEANREQQTHYETIDGQQRLTTFNIIACALLHFNKLSDDFKNELRRVFKSPALIFESRKLADKTLNQLFKFGKITNNFSNANSNIVEGFEITTCTLQRVQSAFTQEQAMEGKTFEGYLNYLFQEVILTRVQVPFGIDLNHYFEIMNTRGEQLEKHEVLKSRLLNCLKDDELALYTFNTIWEACSDMTGYVQTHPNFSPALRTKLFGSRWFNFEPKTFRSLFSIIKPQDLNAKKVFSFFELVHGTPKIEKYIQNVDTEVENNRFQSVINFENFLLHVLKIYVKNDDIYVPLDDKSLLNNFEGYMKPLSTEARSNFAKDFVYKLLKIRFLFDQYILKREYVNNKDHWALKMVHYYPKGENGRSSASFNYVNTFPENRTLTHSGIKRNLHDETILLLSMFHVSTPTMIYKNWLFAVLNFLNDNYQIDSENGVSEKPTAIDLIKYRNFLRYTARNFLVYRYLNEIQRDYEEIIFSDMEGTPYLENWQQFLTYGNIRNNLVFNYIDYLYWLENPDKRKGFAFSFRSSIEHFYPQNPMNHKVLDDEVLNSIGNLCLISASKNSALSNYMPKAKSDHYKDAISKESIKQSIMLETLNKQNAWAETQIKQHAAKIFEMLQSAFKIVH